LNDLPLALRYANALTTRTTGPAVPHWARQMHIFLHEDMAEYETAPKPAARSLSQRGRADPHELHLLIERLNRLKDAEKSSAPSENDFADAGSRLPAIVITESFPISLNKLSLAVAG
jgi:hypothetical protein